MSWAFVMKHDIERMVSMVGSRPVIYFFLNVFIDQLGVEKGWWFIFYFIYFSFLSLFLSLLFFLGDEVHTSQSIHTRGSLDGSVAMIAWIGDSMFQSLNSAIIRINI